MWGIALETEYTAKRLALLGAAVSVAAFAALASAQEGPSGIKGVVLGQTIEAGEQIGIDLNFDGIDDFEVGIAVGNDVLDFVDVGGDVPGTKLESGYIRASDNANPFVAGILDAGARNPEAALFSEGDVIGDGFLSGGTQNRQLSSAFLYEEIFNTKDGRTDFLVRLASMAQPVSLVFPCSTVKPKRQISAFWKSHAAT